MKKIALICLLLTLSCAIIPLGFSYEKAEKSESKVLKSEISEKVFTDKSSDSNIIDEALKYADKDFSDESLKALITIIRNNQKVIPYKYTEASYETDTDFYKRLEKLIKKTNTQLLYNGKEVYIPLSVLSSGYISTCDEYPYIKPVASPWDCLSPLYVYGKEYSCGISIYGIDYLCKSGNSYKEALSYYLRDFEIK